MSKLEQISTPYDRRDLALLWVQKYRPQSFEEMVSQPIVKVQLERIVKSKNLPNLLFNGSAGTGKSSAAEVVARELLGDVWEGNFTELNASDIFEQGKKYLEASRSLARFYDARRGVLDNFKLIMNRLAGIAPLATSYRILFINDADALTLDAQQALRRIIERYNRTCKFILATERPSRIIVPIRSRCLPIHFTQLPEDIMLTFLTQIAHKEGFTLSDELFLFVVRHSGGNLRKALTMLQIAAESISSGANSAELDAFAERTNPSGISELVQLSLQKDALKARQVLDRLLLETGLSGREILTLVRAHIRILSLSEEALATLLVAVGNADYARLQGLNERIQLEAFIFNIGYQVPQVTTVSN
ncbi:MAG: AAA family ATPase [Halobacteriota archaeon]